MRKSFTFAFHMSQACILLVLALSFAKMSTASPTGGYDGGYDSTASTTPSTNPSTNPSTVPPTGSGGYAVSSAPYTESQYCNPNLKPSGLDWSLPQSVVIKNHWLLSTLISQNTSSWEQRPADLFLQLGCSYKLPYFTNTLSPSNPFVGVQFGPIIRTGKWGHEATIQFVVTSQTDKQGDKYNVIAFRGTNFNTLQDILTDIDIQMMNYDVWKSYGTFVPCTGEGQRCVHGGYLKLFAQILKEVDTVTVTGTAFGDYLRNSIQVGIAFSVTGHSLGGAIAQITALYILDGLGGTLPTAYQALQGLTTFAGPSVFNAATVSYFWSRVSAASVKGSFMVNRIVNPRDVVPILFSPVTTNDWKNLYSDWISQYRVFNYTARYPLIGISDNVTAYAAAQQTSSVHICPTASGTAFSDFQFLSLNGAEPAAFSDEVQNQHTTMYDNLVYANSGLLNIDNCREYPVPKPPKTLADILKEAMNLAQISDDFVY